MPVRRPASRLCRPGPEPVPITTVGWRLVDLAGCKLMYEQCRPAKAGWPPRAERSRRRVQVAGRKEGSRGSRGSLGPNQPLQVEEVELPPLGSDEVRVWVRAAGVCGTELHFLDGVYPPAKIPMVLAHEVAGEVVEAAAPSEASDRAPGWPCSTTCYAVTAAGAGRDCSICARPSGLLAFMSDGGSPKMSPCAAAPLCARWPSPDPRSGVRMLRAGRHLDRALLA